MDKKTCSKCKIEKELSDFSLDSRNKSGKKYISKCKKCVAENSKKYWNNNKEVLAIRQKEYRKRNADFLSQYAKEYRERNKDSLKEKKKLYNDTNRAIRVAKQREYYKKNKDKHKKYREENKEKIKNYYKSNRQKINDKYNEKLKKDSKFRLDKYVSCSIRNYLAINNVNKNFVRWEKIVGYTKQQLKEHLEKQFKPEMNWDNYGSYWHIDHIKPKSWFIYESIEDEQFKMCWALENLQPLEASENLSKGNRYEG